MLLKKRAAVDAKLKVIDAVAGGEGAGSIGEEGEADEVVAGDGECGFAVWRNAEDATLTAVAGGHVEVAFNVERHALRTAEAGEEGRGVAVAVDGVDGLAGGGGGAGDEEGSGFVEGEVVGGYRGLQGGEDEDFAGFGGVGGGDLEDGSGAVADEEVAVAVEGDAGGDAHAFGVGGDGAAGRDAVDGSVGSGAGVEVAFGVEGEAGWVEEVAEEGPHGEVAGRRLGVDFKDGDGDLLAAGAGEGDEEVAVGVDGGVRYGVEIFGGEGGYAELDGV